jgi:hypothetical protein
MVFIRKVLFRILVEALDFLAEIVIFNKTFRISVRFVSLFSLLKVSYLTYFFHDVLSVIGCRWARQGSKPSH